MQGPVEGQSWWRRPRVRLSVRALMIVVLILGSGMGWIVRRAHIQRDAVAAIVQGGGRVWYDWEWPGVRYQPDGRMMAGVPRKRGVSPWPKWLEEKLGPDFLGAVKQVQVGPKDPDAVMASVAQLDRLEFIHFILTVPVSDAGIKYVRGLKELKQFTVPIRGSKLTGACLESLKDLTGLRGILLTNTPALTDADLVHLKGLTGLQELQFSSATSGGITDAGLVHFKGMVDMRYLGLIRFPVTSAGLAHLRGMTRLERLVMPASRVEDLSPIGHLTGLKEMQLSSTPITDAGLAPVAGFTALEDLLLADTPITDAGLIHLRDLPKLAELDLYKTRVADAGMPHLSGLKSLRRLILASTGVTDAGLAHLAGLSSLQHLSLYETGVTDAGLVHLVEIPTLTGLNLGKTRITDAGLKHLAGLSSLTDLNLGETQVTDAGLKHLAGLKSLNQLIVQGSAVTAAGIASLQVSIPGLRVAEPSRLGAHR
jgi:internalin A